MSKLYTLLTAVFFTLAFSSQAHAFGRAKPHDPAPAPTILPPSPTPLPSPKPSSTPVPAPLPPTHSYPQVLKGWLDEYSTHIENSVAGSYPGLLSLPANRMAVVCPNWDRLDRGDREKFWSSLLWSIAGPESSRNRTAVYLEDTMGTDVVTGQQITSEGLLQLSYTDVPNYRYRGGDISWEDDRVMALEDYNAHAKTGNPARTLLNAYANLNLGLWIMHRRIEVTSPTGNIETTLGKYWSTMRTTGKNFKIVLDNMKSKSPECFQ